MRKVLAQASVGPEHKQLILKDLKNIFRRIKISLDILLQQQNFQQDQNSNAVSLFKSYPYITLTIPNYQQHREYLEKVLKNNVLFCKFILLISKGDNYEELIKYRNQQILREHCRSWKNTVSCTFDSSPIFTEIEERISKVDTVLGGLDIRGKINQIDAQKKFHLIEDHFLKVDDPIPIGKVPQKKSLFKLFFGLELVRCRNNLDGGAADRGIIIASDSHNYNSSEFIEYEQETSGEDMMQGSGRRDMVSNNVIQNCLADLQSEGVTKLKAKKQVERRQAKRRSEKVLAANDKKNPYLKKQYAEEINISGQTMVQE